MAVTITDNRTVINQADDVTGWTTTTTIATITASPTPIESTAAISSTASSATQNYYLTITSDDMSGDGLVIYWWISHRAEFDTTANVGVGIQIGDGTDRVAYGIMGSDAVAFSHAEGPVVWQCLTLDTGNLGAYSSATIAGSAGTLTLTAITQVGLYFKTVVKAVGGAVNIFWDIARLLDPTVNDGCAISITGGTSGDKGTFDQIATADRGTGDQQAHGIVRKLGAGLYGVQGPIRFGDAPGTSSSWFEDVDTTVAFESRKMTTNKYKIVIVDNGTGTTTFKLGVKVGTGSTATGSNGCTIIVPSGVGGLFDSGTDTDVTDVFIYGSIFSGFTNGIVLGSGHEFIGCTVTGSGAMTFTGSTGATLVNTNISTSTVAADASALVWNINTDTSGKLDGMNFSMGTNAHHAIQLGASAPTTVSFVGITFTGFNASNGANDSELYLADRGSDVTWTINVSNGDSPSYKKARAGDTVNIVSSVNVTVTILNQAGAVIPGVEVAIFQDNAGRTVVLASTPTDENGQVVTTAAVSLGAIIIRARQSTETASFLTSESTSNGIESSTEQINFTSNHNFQTGDAVVYSRNGGSVDIGPEPGTYYINAFDVNTVMLYDTAANAITGGATGKQGLTASGAETHLLNPVRFVAGSATGTIGTTDFTLDLTMITDSIATG